MSNESKTLTMKPLHQLEKITIQYHRPPLDEMPIIKSSKDAEALLRQSFDPHQIDYKEFFFTLFTTNSSHVLGIAQLGTGDERGVSIHIKEIFQIALLTHASGCILCHNHPSGSLNPSQQDYTLTKRVNTLGKTLGLTLLDHIIITSEDYYSMNDHHEI